MQQSDSSLVPNNVGGNHSNAGGSSSQNNSSAVLPDPSGYSTAQIISKAADAVNKTKAYNGNLTVSHSEGFSAKVTEFSGGD